MGHLNPLTLILSVLLTALLAFLAGWLLSHRRNQQKAAQNQASQDHALAALRADLAQTQQQWHDTKSLLAATEAQLKSAQNLLADQDSRHQRALKENQALQEKALHELKSTFQALSAEALKQTQPEFLRLATETLSRFQESAKGDLVQRQNSIAALVKPLEEHLKSYQQRLQETENTRASALGELKRHLETLGQHSQALSGETIQLRRLLSSNQARGRWGEETLRRVVEAAGMSRHCDFTEQSRNQDSQPDLIVHLPGNRAVIIDAKVPDLEGLGASFTQDQAESRKEELLLHAQKLRQTIKALADRDYPKRFPDAFDHVILFLPAESLFSAALEADPSLIVWAAQRHILLATPASLIGLLRAISLSWQQHDQTENAKAIAGAGQELYDRICRFALHLERMRSGLEKATGAFNEAVGSFDRSVRPSGERLVRLGIQQDRKNMPELAPLPNSLRISHPAGPSPAESGSELD